MCGVYLLVVFMIFGAWLQHPAVVMQAWDVDSMQRTHLFSMFLFAYMILLIFTIWVKIPISWVKVKMHMCSINVRKHSCIQIPFSRQPNQHSSRGITSQIDTLTLTELPHIANALTQMLWIRGYTHKLFMYPNTKVNWHLFHMKSKGLT